MMLLRATPGKNLLREYQPSPRDMSGIANPWEYCGSVVQRLTQPSSNSPNKMAITVPNPIVQNRRDRQSGQCQSVSFVAVVIYYSLHRNRPVIDLNQRAMRIKCCGNAKSRIGQECQSITKIMRSHQIRLVGKRVSQWRCNCCIRNDAHRAAFVNSWKCNSVPCGQFFLHSNLMLPLPGLAIANSALHLRSSILKTPDCDSQKTYYYQIKISTPIKASRPGS